ncbi:alpha-N-acetylneuraminate alpha-2,8-sialyltransferase ST8SIA3-like [Saccoglossus kowalevskii]|uniref:Sia-alpha-2,3-Gal-beta-1,4-GlcNAc-R:alpha 2,8-sialyltransferase-like n=1 Tax=Saccoglossus kowalevskii TaxID=10224 RepID=A0ABM0H1E5_SACKO|nr:PREDICTED: sia-alpha-2,3-Gal-beta-1,4-GlcNAc-R:alpha 2,8-sialyltransferase-like [Saccoglossus kowalevskii]
MDKLKMNRNMYKHLPKTLELSHYNTCSVVENSGILLGSGCGNATDHAQFVFRCNLAPITPYIKDAGRKTSLTTLNKSILDKRYGGLHRYNLTRFGRALKDYSGYIWIPLHSNLDRIPVTLTAAYLLRIGGLQVLLMNPDHYLGMQNYWTSHGITGFLTTGFYMTMVAIEMCDTVDLYGFWPFNTTGTGNEVNYHYYDDFVGTKAHNFSAEFSVLNKLHHDEIIRINIRKCQNSAVNSNNVSTEKSTKV